MDLTKLEANKNVMIYQSMVTPVNNFTAKVHVPFTPDYMIVKLINYTSVTTDLQATYAIYCDLVSDFIGSFSVTQVVTGAPPQLMWSLPVSPQSMFKINKPVTSDINFSLQVIPNVAAATLGGIIAIHLDFVKLKSEKPQRIF